MSRQSNTTRQVQLRDLIVFRNPQLWATWPFLPVVRPLPDQAEPQMGVMFDMLKCRGLYGYSATVFLANLFMLPKTEEQFLALPRFVYDTAEEIVEAGWAMD